MKLSNWLRANTSNWPAAATSMPATQDRSAIHHCHAFVYVVPDSLLVWNKMLFAAISLTFNLR